MIFWHIQCFHLMYSEIAWVLVSLETQVQSHEIAWVLVSLEIQVQSQIIVDPDYLPDYLSDFYDYGSTKNIETFSHFSTFSLHHK